MASIDIEGVSYTYPDQEAAEPVLRDVSLAIGDGEFLCLVGHSGCGKSTLLSLLAGLNAPSAGRILVDGRPIEGPSTERAMVFQHYSLFPWMTAVKNVAFSIRRANKGVSKSDASARALEYLEKVGMARDADKYPYQLSGGMQQRVALARALAMESDILLLDEPFGALDAQNRAALQELLVELWAGAQPKKTVVFVTHDLEEAVLLADRIVFMRPGRVERVMPVDLERPRSLGGFEHDARYQHLRADLRALFHLDEGVASAGCEYDRAREEACHE